MSCTEVLNVFSARHIPSPVVPVDIAMRICLSHSPPVHSFLSFREFRGGSVPRLKPLRPCLNPKSEPGLGGQRWDTRRSRSPGQKRVIFADAKGLSLTAVRVFSEFEDDLSDLQFELSDLAGCTPGVSSIKEEMLVFDGPQPSADYLGFQTRLQRASVCLENCSVHHRSLSGTVKVKNIGFEKTVAIRITFDTWKSFRDVSCTYLRSRYCPGDLDTFSFHIGLPDDLPLHERVEFCVRYQCGQHSYWDNHEGKNYRIVASGYQSPQASKEVPVRCPSPSPSQAQQLEFEQFGSPRAASVLFSQWQSWGRFDHAGFW
ncbi:protein phosphatase 1 regulatory subunit 3C-like [Callorhinchus milii]|uniref:protein phosphatase 1 regulatory subunit 3C-like n=1 Tax=Callorhinchus milii TaxID=7868 RepID=UPI001C3F8420|nr:protein phosphatase 1 regulatory subunit 3C-like [Callorhinchus milii]